MQNEFRGSAQALTTAGLNAAADSLSVTPSEIWTVISVETSGCGYLNDRRPQILFERHYFHRLTNGKFDDGDISDPSPGNYGPAGAHQYDRLTRATALDRMAALQSTSWGLGQIMGTNARLAGFSDTEAMVSAMVASEDAQLKAVAGFIADSTLAKSLAQHDWTAFATGYNGPNQAHNHYAERLATAYAVFAKGEMPNLDIRAAQLYLMFAGFQPGPVDGFAGQRTNTAIRAFQRQRGVPETGLADAQVLTALKALARS